MEEETESYLESIPDDRKEEVLETILAQKFFASSYTGPLPPPKDLEEYDKIIASGAERIMAMTENQSAHRMAIEKTVINEELRRSKVGQIFGFIIAILCLLAAFILTILDHETVAGIIGSTTIVGLVTVFVIGKKKQNNVDE